MRKTVTTVLGMVAVATVVTTAYAAVTFDPETGTGFVGKGDVQVVMSWNNKALQDAVKNNGVSFSYVESATYVQDCFKMAGNDRVTNRVEHQFHRNRNVTASVAYEARKNSNGKDGDVTGFWLNGFGAVSGDSNVPTSLCPPGNGDGFAPDPQGQYPEVTKVGSSSSTLFVNGVALQ